MQAAYPTANELQAFLEGQGLTAPADTQLTLHLNRAIQELENRTGYRPFLGSATTTEWRFDPPVLGGPLELRGGFWEISEVRIGLTDTDSDGTLLTAESEYLLLPFNYALDGRPVEQIKLLVHPGSRFKSVKVKGKRGFGEEIPDDVWQALLERAASLAMAEIVQGTSMISEIKQGPIDIKYSDGAGKSKTDKWDDGFSAMVRRYRRIST